MSDWSKAILAVLSGVSIGIILEPLKHWINTFFAARRAKKAIYKELGDVYYTFVLLNDGAPEYYTIALATFAASAFTFYYETHREAFYRLDNWQYLLGLYDALNKMKQQIIKGAAAAQIQYQVSHEFDFRFKSGLIDKAVILYYAHKIQARHRAAMNKVTQ